MRRIVQASWTSQAPGQTDADTVAVGIFGGGQAPSGTPEQVRELISSGEARTAPKSLAVGHAEGKRWIVVGLGARKDFTPERARIAGAVTRERAKELSTRWLCWLAPLDEAGSPDAAAVAALVEGTVLADYSFEQFKSGTGTSGRTPAFGDNQAPDDDQAPGVDPAPDGDPAPGGGENDKPKRLDSLTIAGEGDLQDVVEQAQIVAEAVNAARDLQNRPANDLTPSALAEYARGLGEQIEGLTVETEGREGIVARSMGSFAAVAQGSYQEPALITMRYEPPAASGPVLGLVGKAVTFDSGGISLKPGAKMAEMKFDMSGGAAVIEAMAAIARLRLPVRVLAVVGATENLPSGRSVKPGDIVTASNGKTIEVNNTDAEGRLVLADCLCHAISLGAEQIVDLATLTGAVIIALGSTYSGLMSNDDSLAARVSEAGEKTGEIVWRLPLHDEYSELVKGTYADLDNAPEGRKAGTIVGATFLSNFVGKTPWAHLDIAGSAWDLGRPYAAKGAAGYGVRLLVELARSYQVPA